MQMLITYTRSAIPAVEPISVTHAKSCDDGCQRYINSEIELMIAPLPRLSFEDPEGG